MSPPAPGRGGSPLEKGEVGVKLSEEQGPQGAQGTVRFCRALTAGGVWIKWPSFISALQPPLNQVPLWARAEHRPIRTPSHLGLPWQLVALRHCRILSGPPVRLELEGTGITSSSLHRWEAEIQVPAS